MTSVAPIAPIERTFRAFKNYEGQAPTWVQWASPTERLAIARYDATALERIAPLSPLENLIASVGANPKERTLHLAVVAAQHPEVTSMQLEALACGVPNGKPNAVYAQFGSYTPETQTLLAMFEAVRNNLLSLALPHPENQTHHDLLTVAKWMVSNAPEHLQRNEQLQLVAACNAPGLMFETLNAGGTLHPQTRALQLLISNSPKETDYLGLDDHAFASLIAHNPYRDTAASFWNNAIQRNPCLHRYPSDKLHLICEHHPVRFFASVLARQEMARLPQTEQWFESMLFSVGQHVRQDPTYMETFQSLFDHPKNLARFKTMLRLYVPQEHESLTCLQQLDGNPNTALTHWALLLGHQKTNDYLPIPELSNDIAFGQ